ncbi:MAG: YbdD/YjiX family protein [Acetobacteraceae bacterium]|nr:YbdD/YjiX family protein [Acetobacteraceae bacterium]MBV8521120.1 YbdD/YjiX family protein [Acetobacteraceae bacterium]
MALNRVTAFAGRLGQCAHLMIGLPDYETYVTHMRRAHPAETPMSYEDFFRARQDMRYGRAKGSGFRCC